MRIAKINISQIAVIKKQNSAMTYLEVVIALAILSIFMVPVVAMIIHINNLNDMAYKRSLSYHLGYSFITIASNTIYELEDFSELGSYTIYSLTRLSESSFSERFREDIFTYSLLVTVDSVDFYITNVPQLGFTTNFLDIIPASYSEINIVEVYIVLYMRDEVGTIITRLSRRMPLVR